MRRYEIIQLLDGTHPRDRRAVALALNLLILFSAVAIAIETVPDLAPETRRVLQIFEIFVLVVFTLEYVLRLTCTPRLMHYATSFWGIVDLLAILPAIVLLQPEWAVIRVFRLLRLVRLLKLFRTSRALDRLARAFKSVRGELLVFFVLASMVMYVSAVGIYVFEHAAQPEVFSSIPISIWWAVASLTTVGYGDMVPITLGGRIFTALVLFVGLGVVAGPAAIITTALLEAEKKEVGQTEHNQTKPKSNTEDNE